MWCNCEPCGIICGCITWLLILYAQFVVTLKIIGPWFGFGLNGLLFSVLYNYLALMCLFVHTKAMITDPGSVTSLAKPTVEDSQEDLEEGNSGSQIERPPRRYCRKCKIFKPQRAHHCSICQRCIVKMDHHCPWINNCVGIGNHKFFLQFICCVFLLSLFTLLVVGVSTLACLRKDHRQFHSSHHSQDDVHASFCVTGADGGFLTLLLVLEGTLFGLFTFCMGLDQWQMISTGLTQIDRLQCGDGGQDNGSYSGEIQEDISEVCGGGRSFRFDWLLPTKPCWSPEVRDQVMGYHAPCKNAQLYNKDGDIEAEMVPFKSDAVHNLSQDNHPEEEIRLFIEGQPTIAKEETHDLHQRGRVGELKLK